MKIFDSSNPVLTATASGPVVTITPNPQGTQVVDKALATSGATLVVSAGTPKRIQDAVSSEVFVLPGLPLTKIQWAGYYGFNPLNITLASVVATNTVTIDGVVFTAIASGATGTQFNVGGNDTATAVNLAASINAYFNSQTYPGQNFVMKCARILWEAVVTTTSGNAAATGSVQGSIDGVNWVQVDAVTLASGASPVFISTADDRPSYPFLRFVPATFTGTGVKLVVNVREVPNL